MSVDTVVFDLDGTLVDSVYVHTLAWRAAFRDVGVSVPSYRIHRAIGMGGDRLVAEVAGQQVEDAMGDELRSRHPAHLDDLFEAITPTEGASDLLSACTDHGLKMVLASSSDEALTDRLLELVEGSHRLTRAITGSDAERSKPDGELIERAIRSVDAHTSVVVGDAVWDVRAARDAGVPAIGLLTGGISEAELRDAGAVAVHPTPAALAVHLRETGALLPGR